MSNRNKCFIKVAMCVSLLLFLVSGCKNQSKDLANKDVQTQQDMNSNAGFIDTNEKDDIQNNIISGEKKAKDGDSKISNTIEGDKTEKEISKEKKSIFSNFIGKKKEVTNKNSIDNRKKSTERFWENIDGYTATNDNQNNDSKSRNVTIPDTIEIPNTK